MTITVSDTGRGIKSSDLGGIFGIYSQVDKISQAIEGTGLGLSICKDLVELMQGSIEAESEFGSGSVFRAVIKQKIVDATPIGAEVVANLQTYQFLNRNKIEKLDFTRFYMPQVKVLVVDDVETNLDVAHALLKPYGFSVDCVTSGRQALALLTNGPQQYDCVFMDHMMPDIDGIEVVKIVREQIDTDYARNVPIIAMTANALLESEKLFLKNGFQAYIPKPIDLGRLHLVLTHWIRDRLSHIYQVIEPPPEDGATLEAGVEDGGAPKSKSVTLEVDTDKPFSTEEEISARLSTYFIDGVNLVKGLARYENKTSIYIPLLRSFIRHAPAMIADLKNPTEENLGNYAILVHGFKGACAGICANKVAALALTQEMAAKKPDLEAVIAQNEDFVSAAEILIRELEYLLRNFPLFKGDNREVRVSPDLNVLDRLITACQSFKNSEIQRHLKALESYEYQTDGELIEWLREQADNIEYDHIVERLGEYIKEKSPAR
jgi:CheY-like chemotaxis protein